MTAPPKHNILRVLYLFKIMLWGNRCITEAGEANAAVICLKPCVLYLLTTEEMDNTNAKSSCAG